MSYIGNQPVLQSTEFREEFFPTSNQSAFTTGGFAGDLSVTRNGVLLSESDYVKGTDNVTITLNSAAISGDVVVIRGNRSLAQGVSVSESRVEYVWQSGDTVVQLNADVIPAYTDVYLNGVKLAAADYSINTSTKQVSFTSAPAVGDVIAVVHRNETSALVGLPLKDSYGNEVLSQSGNAVSIGTLRLPTSGGIQDSSGVSVLTEASGVVTLGNVTFPALGNSAVGTVSESSGYPTGDIIETGTYSSPSRRWVRYADGTQIVILEPFDHSFTSDSYYTYTFNFGKNFKSGTKPAVSVSGSPRLSATLPSGVAFTTYGHSDSVVYLRATIYNSNVDNIRELSAIAVGRWF